MLVRPLCLAAASLVAFTPLAVTAQGAPIQRGAQHGPDVTSGGSDSTAGDRPQPVVMELRVGRFAEQTVEAFRLGDDALVPVGVLFDLAELEHHLSPSGRMDATLPARSTPLRIDVASDTMRDGSHTVVVGRAQRLMRDSELYVASIPLGQLLGVHFAVDWQELVVTLLDPNGLPIAQRIARDAARQRFVARGAADQLTPDLALGLSRPSVDGLVLDYALSAQGNAPLQSGSYALSLGANVVGGSLEGTLTSMGPLGDGRSRGTLSWTGVWNDASIVRQLRVGDAFASGPNPRPLRGIAIGNAPYLRLTDFGSTQFVGQVQPGWLVEAYRGGELVAFDSTNTGGQFGLQVPVAYGENPVDIIAYGPYGQTQEFDRVYRIPGALIPAHHFEYGTSLGACTMLQCRATGNVDLRYGLSTRWTVRGGLEQFWRDTLATLTQPYASISGLLTDAWSVELIGIGHASADATVRFEPSLGLQLTTEYTRYATDVEAPILSPAGWTSRWAATALVRPLGLRRLFYIDGQAQRVRTTTGTTTSARLGASVQHGAFRVTPYTRIQRDAQTAGSSVTQPFFGVSAFLLPLARLGPTFGQLWWRGSFEAARASRLSSASIAVSGPISNSVRAELGTTWLRGMAGPSFSLTFTADRGKVRSYTTLSAQQGNSPGVTQAMQGSLVVDPAGHRVMLTPGPSLQRGGIAGHVFLDMNGNGRRDPDESPIAGVRVRVGTETAVSDSDGTFRVWDVVPFEPVRVTVDSMSLTSPLWVPLYDDMSVVPGPNRFQLLDVPIAPGGEIDGRVLQQREGQSTGLAGVRVRFTSQRTGRTRITTTFSDGTYTAYGMAPGRYEVTVDDRDLAQLRALAGVTQVDVPADANGARLTGITLTVRPVLAAR